MPRKSAKRDALIQAARLSFSELGIDTAIKADIQAFDNVSNADIPFGNLYPPFKNEDEARLAYGHLRAAAYGDDGREAAQQQPLSPAIEVAEAIPAEAASPVMTRFEKNFREILLSDPMANRAFRDFSARIAKLTDTPLIAEKAFRECSTTIAALAEDLGIAPPRNKP